MKGGHSQPFHIAHIYVNYIRLEYPSNRKSVYNVMVIIITILATVSPCHVSIKLQSPELNLRRERIALKKVKNLMDTTFTIDITINPKME